MMITQFHRKHFMLLVGNTTKMFFFGHDYQTKSFAMMTYATIPGDCMDRVTSQDGDRVILERLETPRPKVTLKKNWQSQQKHSTSNTDVLTLWKREDHAGDQDVTDHSTDADLAHRTLEHTTSNMDVHTHLGTKGVSTNALLESEAVKEKIAGDEYNSN